jgi:hypothetical protein
MREASGFQAAIIEFLAHESRIVDELCPKGDRKTTTVQSRWADHCEVGIPCGCELTYEMPIARDLAYRYQLFLNTSRISEYSKSRPRHAKTLVSTLLDGLRNQAFALF